MTTKTTFGVRNISKEEYNVLNFGNVQEGQDISAFLEDAIEAAVADGCRKVVIPHGNYYLSSKVDATLATVGSPVKTFHLDGAGARLLVPESNTDGGIRIEKQDNFLRMTVENLHILSEHTASGSVTGGTGLELYSALQPGDAGWGTTDVPELTMDNVFVAAAIPASQGRWDDAIKVNGFWFPRVSKLFADTRHTGTDADTNYETGDGIAFWNCFQLDMVQCRSRGRFQNNIRIDEDGAEPGFGYEDFAITQCYGEGGKDALTIRHSSAGEQAAALKEPGGAIVGGHYNGHRYAINIENRRQFSIQDPLLYTTIGSGNFDYAGAAFCRLLDCHSATVSVRVPEGGHYTNNTDCTRHVHLDGTTSHVLVTGSEFGANGIAIANSSTGTGNMVTGNKFSSYSGSPDVRYVKGVGAGTIEGSDIYESLEPALEFGGGNTGVTYSRRDGGYVQDGLKVTFWADIQLSSKGTDTGDANITLSLPAPVSGADFAFNISYSTGASTQAAEGGIINPSGELELYHKNASDNLNQRITDADFDNTTEIRVSGTYFTEM